MNNFKRGDIVRLKDFDIEIEYYEVEEVFDFSIEGDEKQDIQYRLIQVYPVLKSKKDSRKTVDISELQLVAKYGSEDYDLIGKFIIQEQQKVMDKKVVGGRKKKEDIVLSELKSVDDCLDMINHLNILHKIFNKDIYLKYIKIVEKKAKELN